MRTPTPQRFRTLVFTLLVMLGAQVFLPSMLHGASLVAAAEEVGLGVGDAEGLLDGPDMDQELSLHDRWGEQLRALFWSAAPAPCRRTKHVRVHAALLPASGLHPSAP